MLHQNNQLICFESRESFFLILDTFFYVLSCFTFFENTLIKDAENCVWPRFDVTFDFQRIFKCISAFIFSANNTKFATKSIMRISGTLSHKNMGLSSTFDEIDTDMLPDPCFSIRASRFMLPDPSYCFSRF